MTQACLQCVSSVPQSTAVVRYVVFTVAKAHHESQLEGWWQSNTLPLQTHIRRLPKSPIVFKIDAQKVLGCKAELSTLGKCLRAALCHCVSLSRAGLMNMEGSRASIFFSIPHRTKSRRWPASDVCGDQTWSLLTHTDVACKVERYKNNKNSSSKNKRLHVWDS